MNLEFLNFNGYGQFILPAFIFTIASCLILYVKTKKELKKHSFDVVSMFHSLEHIHDVNDTLKTVYNSLNKNGILILTIPNHNAYERKFFQSTWVAYDAPRHLYHFDYETIKLLLNKNKFDIIMTKGVYLDTLYNILMSLNKNIFSFFKFIGIASLSFINILYNKKYSSSILLVCKKNEKIKL